MLLVCRKRDSATILVVKVFTYHPLLAARAFTATVASAQTVLQRAMSSRCYRDHWV